jgi:hypothetical protein
MINEAAIGFPALKMKVSGRFARTLDLHAAGRIPPVRPRGPTSVSKSQNDGPTLRVLIAAYVATGQVEKAREFAARVLAIAPDFGLTAFQRRTPLVGETFVQRLRIAGLPE